jgi:hypothetical protein
MEVNGLSTLFDLSVRCLYDQNLNKTFKDT